MNNLSIKEVNNTQDYKVADISLAEFGRKFRQTFVNFNEFIRHFVILNDEFVFVGILGNLP